MHTRRARIAEPSIIPEFDSSDERYEDMQEEEGSVVPAYVPEAEQPVPPVLLIPLVHPVVPSRPTTVELVALMSASIAEAFKIGRAHV